MPTSTFSTEGPKCPYCGDQITADDGMFYDEMNYTEEECYSCGKTFEVSVTIETTLETNPID